MKTRLHITLVFLLCAGLLIAAVVLRWIELKSSVSLGRLVFTDYAKPNFSYTVDVFNLDQGKRFSLSQERYQDIGFQSFIDKQHIYFSACFAQNNPMFCSAYVSEVIAPKEIHRFDYVKQFWKEEYSSPIWSPDGKHIAFSVVEKGTQNASLFTGDTYVINADGTNSVDLTSKDNINGFGFVWSPDSQQIAFVCSNSLYLCISHFDGSHLQKLGMPLNTKVSDMAWSPDGSQIVFSLNATDYHNAELYLVNADGSNLHRLLKTASNHHENPVWSPDGSRIAFRSGEQNNNVGEIYSIKPDGSNLYDLSQSLDGNEFGAVWSPDSNKIAFFSDQYQKGAYLYIVDVDGENLQQITENSTRNLTDTAAPDLFWIP